MHDHEGTKLVQLGVTREPFNSFLSMECYRVNVNIGVSWGGLCLLCHTILCVIKLWLVSIANYRNVGLQLARALFTSDILTRFMWFCASFDHWYYLFQQSAACTILSDSTPSPLILILVILHGVSLQYWPGWIWIWEGSWSNGSYGIDMLEWSVVWHCITVSLSIFHSAITYKMPTACMPAHNWQSNIS